MWKQAALIILAAVALTGCGDKQEEHSGHEMKMEMTANDMIQVDLTLPASVKVSEEAVFTALVTKGGEPVTDADSVEFEWWVGEGEHHKQVVSHAVDGKYELKQSFNQAGTYTIISHVQVEDMHSMPEKTFEVSE